MSYAVPRQWSHGDQPVATDMQKYSDGLAYLEPLLDAVIRNHAHPYSLYEDTQEFWLIHTQRYLVFSSTGRIVDPAAVGEDVSLSTDGTYGGHDLDAIPWMSYGKLYKVIGCSVCFEDGTGT